MSRNLMYAIETLEIEKYRLIQRRRNLPNPEEVQASVNTEMYDDCIAELDYGISTLRVEADDNRS